MVYMNINEALSIFSEHIPDIRKACVENAKHIMSTPYKVWDIDSDQPVTPRDLLLHAAYIDITNRLAPLERTIKRIDNRRRRTTGGITDDDIVSAKEHPIQELWTEFVGTPIRMGMVKCCFHPDKTASMSLRRHNRYHCFGCDEKGDSIDLYMKLQKVDFVQAVKQLI